MIEFAAGFGLSLVVGIGLGIAMGLNRLTEYAVDPFVWFLYSSPLIAFYPLIIVWLGFGEREATGTSMAAIIVIAVSRCGVCSVA